jgi:hypothetical protein
VEALRGAGDLVVAGAFGHAEALAWDGDWSLVDVVVVDAADEGRRGDQFPGVGVVRRIVASTGGGERRPILVVVTGHYLHDGLRQRMAQAGADFYFLRANLRTREQLVDVVRHPDNYRRGVVPVADLEQRRLLGVTSETALDELVAYAGEHGLDLALDGDGGGGAGRDDPRSRRWLRHRREMARVGRVRAVNITTGDAPRGAQSDPSWRQLRQIYRWAARIRPVDGDDPPGRG